MYDVVSAWNGNLASTCGFSCSSRCIQFVYCSRYVWPSSLPHPHSQTQSHTHSHTNAHFHTHTLTLTHSHSSHSHSHTHCHTHTLTLTHIGTLPHPHYHTHSHTIITLPPRMFLTYAINSFSTLCGSYTPLHIFSVYFRVRAGHENSKEALLLVHQVRCRKYPSICVL